MNKIIGVAIVIAAIAGIVSSVYFGLVVMFIGGIVDIINQIKATNTEAVAVAWGVAKIVFAGTCTGLGIVASCALGSVGGAIASSRNY